MIDETNLELVPPLPTQGVEQAYPSEKAQVPNTTDVKATLIKLATAQPKTKPAE